MSLPVHTLYGMSPSKGAEGDLSITYIAVISASTQNVLDNLACASILRTLSITVWLILSANPFSSSVFNIVYSRLEPDSLQPVILFELPSVFAFVVRSNDFKRSTGFSFESCMKLLEDGQYMVLRLQRGESRPITSGCSRL